MIWLADYARPLLTALALTGGFALCLLRAGKHWRTETGTPKGDTAQAVAAGLWLGGSIACGSGFGPLVQFFVAEVLW